jgi:hypothetical protein
MGYTQDKMKKRENDDFTVFLNFESGIIRGVLFQQKNQF